MNQYRVSFDESYMIAGLSRYRRQRKVFPWFIAVKVVCTLCLSALLAIIVGAVVTQTGSNATPLLWISVVLATFIVLLLLGPRLDYFFIKRRLKKSPFYGGEMKIAVRDAGVSIDTQQSQTSMAWSAFTAAKRVTGGFLLHSDPSQFYWLPDEALMVGAPADVERLLRENIRTYANTAA